MVLFYFDSWLLGYSGDVWYPQPAPKDHPWRYMPNHAMTPHISGTTIDAQVWKLKSFLFLPFFFSAWLELRKMKKKWCSCDMQQGSRTCWRGTSREKNFHRSITLWRRVNSQVSTVRSVRVRSLSSWVCAKK